MQLYRALGRAAGDARQKAFRVAPAALDYRRVPAVWVLALQTASVSALTNRYYNGWI